MDEPGWRLAAIALWLIAIAVGLATHSVGFAVAVLAGGGFFLGIAYRIRSYGDLGTTRTSNGADDPGGQDGGRKDASARQ